MWIDKIPRQMTYDIPPYVDGDEFNFVLYIYGNGTDMETAKIKLNGIRKAVPLNVLLELLK